MLVKILSVMLENTFTADDVVGRISLLRQYYNVRLFAGGEHTGVREVLGELCDDYTLNVLEAWENSFERAGILPLVVFEALDAVEEDLRGLPAVTLYVPIRFGQEHVERFCKWFRSNVQPNIILDLKVDPRVGGGCGLVWNDIYYDLSLRYHIAQHREEVVGMFNKYTHA